MLRPRDLIEVDVRTLRQRRMVPELPPEHPQRTKRFLVVDPQQQIRDLHRQMRDARVAQLGIAAAIGLAVEGQDPFRLQNRRRIEPDAEPVAALPPAGDETRRRFHADGVARITAFAGVAADTARAVAAHLAERTVGVVEPHRHVRTGRRCLQHHHAVRTDARVPIAESADQARKILRRNAERLLHRVQHDEIIARAVHLGKSHLTPPLAASFYIVLYRPAAESKCNFLLKTLQKMLCETHLTFRAETATILLYHLELYSHGKRSIPHANVL